MQIAVALIERLLSWPVAIAILCFVFRRNMAALIDRIDFVKGPGLEVSSPRGSVEKQLNNPKPAGTDSLLPAPGQPQINTTQTDLAAQQQAARTYGGDRPIIEEGVQSIIANLQHLQFPLASEETTHLLARHLTVTQLLYRAENVYRRILGSQIAGLHYLETGGLSEQERLRPIFERARAKSPRYYGEYTFEEWLHFLELNVLIAHVPDGRIGVSVFGLEFLAYLRDVKAPKKPH